MPVQNQDLLWLEVIHDEQISSFATNLKHRRGVIECGMAAVGRKVSNLWLLVLISPTLFL